MPLPWAIVREKVSIRDQGFSSNFGKKAPDHNWEKMIDLTAKLGEINDIEHNKGSKIYHQIQVNANHTT